MGEFDNISRTGYNSNICTDNLGKENSNFIDSKTNKINYVQSGLSSFLLIVMTASFWFVFVGFAHHHPNTFHDGDEPRPEPDFG